MSNLAFDYTKTFSSGNILSDTYRSPVVEFTASDLLDIANQQLFHSIKKPVWGMFINDEYRKFAKPVALSIYKVGSFYFSENESLNICGEGSNIDESIIDALSHIRHFYNYYQREPDNKFTRNALELKQVYNNLF